MIKINHHGIRLVWKQVSLTRWEAANAQFSLAFTIEQTATYSYLLRSRYGAATLPAREFATRDEARLGAKKILDETLSRLRGEIGVQSQRGDASPR